jgi:tetratricopeptide (TPR) repeat protein
MPLSGLSITAIGDQVAVREGRQHWDTDTGQYLLALEVSVEGGEVQLINRDGGRRTAGGKSAAARPRPGNQAAPGAEAGNTANPALDLVAADEHYDTAYDLEEANPTAAIAAYERCLAANKEHTDARLNCGRLLHIAGRFEEAEKLYRDSTEQNATLLFNLAVLLEDLGRESEAMDAYRDVLLVDPGFADAHFNLSRLHELAGNRRESFRHLLAYKRASD